MGESILMSNLSEKMNTLLEVMKKLRDPVSGCPWDQSQSYQSIVPYTIEEAYEVADAIEQKDFEQLKNELGDLLFQVVFYAQIAQEEGRFDFYDIVDGICSKLIVRHPHVFADKKYEHESEIHAAWEQQKHQDRLIKNEQASFLDDIPKSLPSLKRAQKMQKRAAKQGFDWPNIEDVWLKLDEELAELKDEIASSNNLAVNKGAIEDELGDVFFTLVNLSRFLSCDSEWVTAKASKKFESRFRVLEKRIRQDGKDLSSMNIDEMEDYWQAVKRARL